ncbi:MAG TPA: hypothetical protein VFG78_00655, partial [Gemmatimonadota bacterium]|nr:hypothetical protein [Gemmatimonadota bacterium]
MQGLCPDRAGDGCWCEIGQARRRPEIADRSHRCDGRTRSGRRVARAPPLAQGGGGGRHSDTCGLRGGPQDGADRCMLNIGPMMRRRSVGRMQPGRWTGDTEA